MNESSWIFLPQLHVRGFQKIISTYLYIYIWVLLLKQIFGESVWLRTGEVEESMCFMYKYLLRIFFCPWVELLFSIYICLKRIFLIYLFMEKKCILFHCNQKCQNIHERMIFFHLVHLYQIPCSIVFQTCKITVNDSFVLKYVSIVNQNSEF